MNVFYDPKFYAAYVGGEIKQYLLVDLTAQGRYFMPIQQHYICKYTHYHTQVLPIALYVNIHLILADLWYLFKSGAIYTVHGSLLSLPNMLMMHEAQGALSKLRHVICS